MRPGILLSWVSLLFLAGWVGGAPLVRREPEQVQVRPFFVQAVMETFAGQKQARAIVIGNGRTYLGLYVFDLHGNCVALDDFANLSTRDDLAVEWYPPENGAYGIDIQNFGRLPNTAEVAFP